MVRDISALTPVLLLALVATGCSPGAEPSSVTAFDTVTTIFGPNADFAGANTFTVVDSIIHLVDPNRPDEISREYDALIVQRLRDNMLAAGWTEIPAPDASNQPHVALQAAATTSDTLVIEYWPPYWGWYPGWGYPGYGWGWGWANVYSYTTGTVLTAMLDLRNPDMASETVPVMWLSALNGVISAPSNVETRIVTGLDQSFEQSPYLRK